MKRTLLFVAPFLLAACGGAGSLSLDINSDDAAQNNALSTVRAFESVNLTTVKSVKVTVREIWVHVEGTSAKDQVKGDEVEDSGSSWQQVSSEEKTIDLMTVRNQTTQPLGDIAVPQGKLTQIRLKLKGTAAEGSDKYRIAGAVEEATGAVCDLIVPKSAIEPGVRISGDFKAMQIDAGGKHHAIISLKLSDSEKLADGGATCAYRLNPELKVKKFEKDENESGDDKSGGTSDGKN